jgi:serine/threonine-protein kinase
MSLPRWPDALLERFEPLDVLSQARPDLLYLATEREGERPCLVLLASLEDLPAWRAARLRANQRVAEEHRHPRILLPLESGEVDGRLYVVYPAPQGESLVELRAENPRPWGIGTVAEMARGILQGLVFLHGKGLTYGCLGPRRAYRREDGSWLLLDSSASRALGSGEPEPLYQAPAQDLGQAPDPRDDLYTLGLMVYELLVGGHPLADVAPGEVSRVRLQGVGPAPRSRRGEVPEPLSRWVMRLLEPARSRRPEDAEDALRELEAALPEGDPIEEPEMLLEGDDPIPEAPPPVGSPSSSVELPPMAPGYSAPEDASWWQVALVVAAVQVAALLFLRTLAMPAEEEETLRLPDPQTMAQTLEDSSDRVEEEAQQVPAPVFQPQTAPVPGDPDPPPPPPPPTTPEAPAASPPPPTSPAVSPAPSSPFPGDYPDRVRAELDLKRSRTVTPEGELEPSGTRTAESRPFLSSDPLAVPRTLRGLDEVARFRTWARSAEARPGELPEELQAALRTLDETFRSHGLRRPFQPFLYVRPASSKASAGEGWRRILGREPPEGLDPGWEGGWFAAALREADTTVEEIRKLEALARRGSGEDPWVRAVHVLSTPEGRLELAGQTEAGRMAWRRMVYATSRALRADTKQGEPLAQLVDEVLSRTRALGALEVLVEEPEELLPGEDSGPRRLLLARLARHRREARELANVASPDLVDEELRRWRRAGERGTWSPMAQRREQIAALEELRVLAELEDPDAGHEFWQAQRNRLAGYEERVQAEVYRGLFELMGITRSRLELDPVDFERVARRARYLAPLLGRSGTAELEASIEAAEQF